MRHLPLELLKKLADSNVDKIIELTNEYSDNNDVYSKLEKAYDNLYKIINAIYDKTNQYPSEYLDRLASLEKIFVVDGEPVEYPIDSELLKSAATKKECYTPEETATLLMWTVNNTRNNLRLDSDTNNLIGTCGLGQFSSLYPLQKLGLKVTINNAKNVDNAIPRHAFGTVIVPMLIDGQIEEHQFLIDCTYSQFFHLDNCVENVYYKDGRTPGPGYFVKDNKDLAETASTILKYGFIEATEDNLKKYFYGFFMDGIRKEDLDERKLKLNMTNISEVINSVQEDYDYTEEEFNDWGFNLNIVEDYHK